MNSSRNTSATPCVGMAGTPSIETQNPLIVTLFELLHTVCMARVVTTQQQLAAYHSYYIILGLQGVILGCQLAVLQPSSWNTQDNPRFVDIDPYPGCSCCLFRIATGVLMFIVPDKTQRSYVLRGSLWPMPYNYLGALTISNLILQQIQCHIESPTVLKT